VFAVLTEQAHPILPLELCFAMAGQLPPMNSMPIEDDAKVQENSAKVQ
jgi:hypothetical protein